MKKIVLSVSVCMLALMAGCTKENVNQQQTKGKEISFTGTISETSSRVELGQYDPTAKALPLYWLNGDGIVIAVFDKDGNVVKHYPYGPDWPMNCIARYAANTETASVTTGFEPESSLLTIPADVTEGNVIAYHAGDLPYMVEELDVKALDMPAKREQQYDVLKEKAADGLFLVAKTPYTGQESVDLQFSNAFATMMIGVKGDAQIDSVKVSNPVIDMTYGGNVKVDLTNAPAPGEKDTNLLTSFGGKFINDGTDQAPVAGYKEAVLKLSRPMQLKSDVKWLPVMIMPISGITQTPLTFTIYATDKTGKASSITRTITVPDDRDELPTNSIVYASLKDIKATDLNQDAPRSDWQPGEVVFEDDLSWIQTGWDAATLDIYGWTDPYHNPFFPKYNHTAANAALNKNGYIVPETDNNIEMLYSYDGMLQVGVPDNGASRVFVPLSPLYNYTGNVTVTFRAAPYYNKYGEGPGQYDSWKGVIPVKAMNGTALLKDVTIEPTAQTVPFTWYEYTVLVENATGDTQIIFGQDPDDYDNPRPVFFLDNIRVSVTNGETENLTGTKIDRPAPKLMFAEPALQNGTATIPIPAVKDVSNDISSSDIALLPNIRFAVNGPWELVVPAGNDWVKVREVDWSDWEDPDDADRYQDTYGNEMTSIFYIQTMEDNDSGAERSVDVQLKSGDVVLATYTITQPKAGVRADLYGADFGDHTDPIYASSTLTATDWGIGSYDLSYLNIAYNAEGTNPGLQLNNTAKSKDYEGATGLGNLLFVNSVAADPAGGGGGGEIEPWAEGDPDPTFKISLPITNGAYLYLNFAVWAKDAWGFGEFVAEVEYDDAATSIQKVEARITNTAKWKYFTNRLEIPDGASNCTVKFYAKDVQYSNGNTESAAGAYRIDDVTVAYRQK